MDRNLLGLVLFIVLMGGVTYWSLPEDGVFDRATTRLMRAMSVTTYVIMTVLLLQTHFAANARVARDADSSVLPL